MFHDTFWVGVSTVSLRLCQPISAASISMTFDFHVVRVSSKKHPQEDRTNQREDVRPLKDAQVRPPGV